MLPLTAVGTVHFDNKDLAFTDFTVSLDRSSVTLNGGLDLTDAQTPVFHQFAVKTDDFDLDAIPLDLPLSAVLRQVPPWMALLTAFLPREPWTVRP